MKILKLAIKHPDREPAAFKRPAADSSGKWVIEEYFETDWADTTTPAMPLPVALDLKALYDAHCLYQPAVTQRGNFGIPGGAGKADPKIST
ncbi:MAG: hypothetical protein V1844_06210 [Pseudomonadota bacterium]